MQKRRKPSEKIVIPIHSLPPLASLIFTANDSRAFTQLTQLTSLLDVDELMVAPRTLPRLLLPHICHQTFATVGATHHRP
ncbi:hypothetical protein DMENIID0001_037500 [Sergentomyia squamirostris]